jgi:CRP-like cAMP-binding protein
MTQNRNIQTPADKACWIKADFLAPRIAMLKLDDLALSLEPHLDALVGAGVTSRDFEAGETVFPLPHAAPVMLVLIDGAVDIFVRCGSHRTPVKRIEARTVFGQAPELGFVMHDTEGEAACPSTVLLFDLNAARALIRPAAFNWITVMAPRYSAWEIDAYRMVSGTSETRLVQLLLDLANPRGVVAGITQAELARRVQLTREGLWRILARLRGKGLLKWKRRQITLLDRDALRDLARAVPSRGRGSAKQGS